MSDVPRKDGLQLEPFAQSVTEARARLHQLEQGGVRDAGPAVVANMLEELHTSMEELLVAEEELRRQQEALDTAQARAEVEARRYQELFQLAPEGYLVTGPDGAIQEANLAAGKLLSIPSDRLAGKPLAVFGARHEDCQALSAEMSRLKKAAAPRESFICLQPREGEPIDAAVTATAIHDARGELAGIRWLIRDVTERRRAEARLLESAQLFRRLFDESPVGVAIVSLDHRFQRVNAALSRIMGYPAEELVGHQCEEFIHPDDRERHRVECARLAAGEIEEYRADERLIRKDGSIAWVRASARALRDSEGRVQSLLPVVEEITDRKEAEGRLRESEQLFRRLFDQSPVGTAIVSPDQKVQRVNEALSRILGYTPEELIGHPVDEVIHPDDRELHQKQSGKLAAGETEQYQADVRFVRKDGRVVWVRLSVRGVRDAEGRVRLLLPVVEDITERKEAEEQLHILNATLEARVAERTAQLEEASRAKDQFLAMLAHELRNPLAVVLNSVQLLGMAPSEEIRQRAQASIERQVRHQARLLDDLLNVTRITRGRMLLRREILDLAPLIEDTLTDWCKAAEQAGVNLHFEIPKQPLCVEGDPTRLAQVLDNLLHNAIKFTSPGGQITVDCRTDPEEREVTLSVRDTGAGIEPALLPHLFEAFSQADRSLERSRGGLGLGLALVKGLVEMHGGSVRVESAGLGKGATFSFTLPLVEKAALSARPAAPAPAPAPAVAPRPAAKRVLVIEDNRDMVATLRDLLELSGYTVEQAYSGPEGIAAARRTHPEIILCDIGLPGLDGYGVARALRADPATASVRLLALSGYGQEDDRRRALEAGFDQHLTKPVDADELERAMAGA